MKVQQVNNQQTFKAIHLPEYRELSASTRAVVREIDDRFKPQGIVYETMFFSNEKDEEIAIKKLFDTDIFSITITSDKKFVK